VAGIPVPASPTGFGDVTVPTATANPVSITLATSGIPVGSTVKVSVTPQLGRRSRSTVRQPSASLDNATTSVSLDIPFGHSVLSAQTSFIVLAAVGDALSRFAQGERVEKVTLTSTLGQGEKATLHTVAGRQFEVEPALLKLAALLAVIPDIEPERTQTMKTRISLNAAAFLCAAALASANASAVSIDFETLADGAAVTNQFAGLVTFSNATASKPGSRSTRLDFPPHSGSVVVSDDGGPMTLLFSSPVTQVSAFFTYAAPLTLTAWDAFDAFLGSTLSAFSTNAALSGDPGSSPNEFLELAFASGISKLTVTGDAGGGSFVLDDLVVHPDGSARCRSRGPPH
jgi:hypothetical protein